MGPTGSGKSALALELARHLPLEIVSVDSAQVYRGLDIGTAKPNPAQRARVPHHLLDLLEPHEAYSAARFRDDARAAITAIQGRGRLPLLVGGTGLYFRALADGLAPLPAADPALRAELAALRAAEGNGALHARLAAIDPAAAERIHPNDPQRLLRALEVARLAGRPLSELWRSGAALPGLDCPVVRLAVAPAERAVLHARLAARLHAMVARGFLNEVRALLARPGLDSSSPGLRTVGYREAVRHLAGTAGPRGWVEEAIVASRQLAKRQFTWLRREPALEWLDSGAPDLPGRVLGALAARGVVAP